MKKCQCQHCLTRDAEWELTVYARPNDEVPILHVVWRGLICAEDFEQAKVLIKRGEGSHLLLILPLKFPRLVHDIRASEGSRQ